MKWWLAMVAAMASGLAGGEPLPLGDDLAFRAEAVEAFAERGYRQQLAALRAAGQLDRDPATLERLGVLIDRLRDAAEPERPGTVRLGWQIHTCRRCGENASAMSGGRLLLGEEFLATLNLSDDELGFLLAHEMAHVLLEHTREFATVARYFVDNGLRREYWDIQRELDASLPVQYRMAFIAEQQELEADREGFFLGARAGFEPAAMMTLIGKLDPNAQSAAPATHPSNGQRMQQAASMLQSARILHARAIGER
jgi:predicted Zn-dependent protease